MIVRSWALTIRVGLRPWARWLGCRSRALGIATELVALGAVVSLGLVGCASGSAGSPRPSAIATPVRGPFTYLTARPGTLPPSGRPSVAGIRLPTGHRAAGGLLLWSTDQPVRDPLELAQRLAAAFPHTGLWPLLWPAWDKPAPYMYGPDSGPLPPISVTRLLAPTSSC